jgi:hypothetical protein
MSTKNKASEDSEAVIALYRSALSSAQAEVRRLQDCLALLKAEKPKRKREDWKPNGFFSRTY